MWFLLQREKVLLRIYFSLTWGKNKSEISVENTDEGRVVCSDIVQDFVQNIISCCSYNQEAYKRLEFRLKIIQECNFKSIKLEEK